ncbi:MAG: hypothetical protein IJW87_01190 [Clostridia bacterium]|nr:hypothetical protein [Clostridia bacterium]
MRPNFKNKSAETVYALVKRLYIIGIFAYVPLIMLLTLYADLRSGGGFIDFGYWLPLLLLLWVTLPFYQAYVIAGLSAEGLLVMKTHASADRKRKLLYVLTLVIAGGCALWNLLCVTGVTEGALNTAPIVTPILCTGAIVFLLIWRKKMANALPEAETPVWEDRLSAIKNGMTAGVIVISVLAALFVPYETVRFADGGTVQTRALAYTVMDWNRGKDASICVADDLPYADEEQHTCVYFFPHNFKNYGELWDMKH